MTREGQPRAESAAPDPDGLRSAPSRPHRCGSPGRTGGARVGAGGCRLRPSPPGRADARIGGSSRWRRGRRWSGILPRPGPWHWRRRPQHRVGHRRRRPERVGWRVGHRRILPSDGRHGIEVHQIRAAAGGWSRPAAVTVDRDPAGHRRPGRVPGDEPAVQVGRAVQAAEIESMPSGIPQDRRRRDGLPRKTPLAVPVTPIFLMACVRRGWPAVPPGDLAVVRPHRRSPSRSSVRPRPRTDRSTS